MAVEHIETELRLNKVRPMTAARHPWARRGFATEKSAHKLRATGFSYRRIAIELQVRYDQVASWLSSSVLHADQAAPPQPCQSPAAPAAPQVPVTDCAETEDYQTRRIDDLMATLRQMSSESREREQRLYRIIEAEGIAAREQMARRDAQIHALRVIVDELQARVSRLDTEDAAPWRRVWRRAPVR